MSLEEMAEKLDAINRNPDYAMDGSGINFMRELKPYGLTIVYDHLLKCKVIVQIRYVAANHEVYRVD